MAMKFAIEYHVDVIQKDIPKLAKRKKEQIKFAIEEKLTKHPDVFGIPLRMSLKGYRKLRVGDYRIVFRIEKSKVKIFLIQHRSVVYKYAGTRGAE
ncbi:type II toxin-antitoxin system RelE/ParE family toxin [bacterium]|nr:type II toxin-antitoxin system RelE/ParE family toxin [bacterium]